MSQNEISSKVKELRELRRMAEELDAEITAIEDGIKAHMTAAQTDILTGDDWKVSWKLVSSTRLDSKALKAELPEIAQRYSKAIETRRFTVA